MPHPTHPFFHGGLSGCVGGDDIHSEWLHQSCGLSSELCWSDLQDVRSELGRARALVEPSLTWP